MEWPELDWPKLVLAKITMAQNGPNWPNRDWPKSVRHSFLPLLGVLSLNFGGVFEGPGASNTTKIPRKDPQEREERMKTVAGEGKKREILGSTPFGPQPFRPVPPPLEAPPFVVQKFNIPKLADVEIGRSRNWPTSKKKKKLAEVEIGRSRPRSPGSGLVSPHATYRITRLDSHHFRLLLLHRLQFPLPFTVFSRCGRPFWPPPRCLRTGRGLGQEEVRSGECGGSNLQRSGWSCECKRAVVTWTSTHHRSRWTPTRSGSRWVGRPSRRWTRHR